MCGTISLPASIVSVSSGTSGHAPVQAFQRLHRGYLIHLFYCFREQSAWVWCDEWRRFGAPAHTASRTYGKLSPIETDLCAVERTEQNSADPLLRGVCQPRSPHGSKPTSWLSPRPTDRHYFSRCHWMEIKTGGWRQQPLPLQPAKLLSEGESRIKYYRTKFKLFCSHRLTFLNLGAVRWDTAIYSLWIMWSVAQAIRN